jgi:hypothetical protein
MMNISHCREKFVIVTVKQRDIPSDGGIEVGITKGPDGQIAAKKLSDGCPAPS